MSDDGWTWDELPFARAGLLLEYRELKQQRDALRAEVELLKVGHDRYEFLRRCSLRQLTQIWEAALKSDAQFDATVDKLRLPDPTGESL